MTYTTRFRLDFGYDGTEFAGWAKQPGLRTVQEKMENGINQMFGFRLEPVRLTVAGRTDAGVHAIAQTAHLDLDRNHLEALGRAQRGRHARSTLGAVLKRKLNGVLGEYSSISVYNASFAPEGFDARFSAIWRRYEYRIADGRSRRNPLLRAHSHYLPHMLNDEAMLAASEIVLGLHNFLTFCKPRERATTIRTLQEFSWKRNGDDILIAHLQADAFCHSMVRALVGAVVAVGKGRLEIDDLRRSLEAPKLARIAPVMSARGLTLVGVGYPSDEEMREQAITSRARRTLSTSPLRCD